jgi:hypothetical protein
MTDGGPDQLILRQLRAIDGKLDRVIADLHDIKIRVTALEEGHAALLAGLAGINRRLDRQEERLDRIERRLGLIEESSS